MVRSVSLSIRQEFLLGLPVLHELMHHRFLVGKLVGVFADSRDQPLGILTGCITERKNKKKCCCPAVVQYSAGVGPVPDA